MKITSYNNLEEMFADMGRAEDEANAGLCTAQRDLAPGDCWANFGALNEYGFIVFGKSYTLDEYVTAEMSATDPDEQNELYGSADGQRAELIAQHTDQWRRGYMFGQAYSIAETRGELGSTHKGSAWPITPETFASAQAAEWNTDTLVDANPAAFGLLNAAYKAWRAHRIVQLTAAHEAAKRSADHIGAPVDETPVTDADSSS